MAEVCGMCSRCFLEGVFTMCVKVKSVYCMMCDVREFDGGGGIFPM
jgi:hypothetical protein